MVDDVPLTIEVEAQIAKNIDIGNPKKRELFCADITAKTRAAHTRTKHPPAPASKPGFSFSGDHTMSVTNKRHRDRHRELGLDQRTTRKARFVQLVDSFADELGGTAGLNPAELILVKQAASTALACEKLQERLLDDAKADDDAANKALVPLSNALVRLQSALGTAKRRRAEKPKESPWKRTPQEEGPTQ
jgi:hypothetical protein